ncbi:hypothetical protein GGR56DRAFT_125432 [Xylariaceae sp. FL0804]|nr:hypothetical protein GGR56DRAFT_125432 [Xylariaceae sp. FL0804]
MAPMGLLDLPNEVVHEICRMFCHHCTIPDNDSYRFLPAWVREHRFALTSLSRSCRLLRAVAQPLLYHELWLEYSGPHYQLLRTLMENPTLAQHVRYFEDAERGLDMSGSDEVGLPLSLEDTAGRLGLNLEVAINYDGASREDIEVTKAYSVILALIAPNLDTLSLCSRYRANPSAAFRGSNIQFTCLRSLHFFHWNSEGGFDLEDFRDLLQIAPNIEYLKLYMCLKVSSSDLPLANVRTLQFSFSYLSAAHLLNVVRACPKLAQFSYKSAGGVMGQYSNDDEATPSEVHAAVSLRKNTLKRLDLDFGVLGENYLWYTEMSGFEPEHQMKSLADFTALEELVLRLEYFYTDEDEDDNVNFHNSPELLSMLPPHIRKLSLAGLQDSYEGTVLLAEAVKEGRFPHLKKVQITPEASEMERIKESFAAVGVECSQYRPYF